jgi:hypothetical protein
MVHVSLNALYFVAAVVTLYFLSQYDVYPSGKTKESANEIIRSHKFDKFDNDKINKVLSTKIVKSLNARNESMNLQLQVENKTLNSEESDFMDSFKDFIPTNEISTTQSLFKMFRSEILEAIKHSLILSPNPNFSNNDETFLKLFICTQKYDKNSPKKTLKPVETYCLLNLSSNFDSNIDLFAKQNKNYLGGKNEKIEKFLFNLDLEQSTSIAFDALHHPQLNLFPNFPLSSSLTIVEKIKKIEEKTKLSPVISAVADLLIVLTTCNQLKMTIFSLEYLKKAKSDADILIVDDHSIGLTILLSQLNK